MKRKYLGIILMACAAALLAVSNILMKVIPQRTNLLPHHMAIWRFTIAAPLAWLFYLARGRKKQLLPKRPWQLIALGGVFAIANFCAVFALDRLSSSLYVIIVYIYPSLVVLYSLISGRSIPRLYWIGVPLTFIGLFLVAFQLDSDLSMDMLGFVISIVNAVAMAAYVLLSEKFLKNVGNKTLGTNWMMLGAMLSGWLVLPLLGIRTPNTQVGWVLLLSLGVIGTALPILLMNLGIQMLGAARGSVIITLQPVLVVLLSTIFLGDALSLQQWVGGVLVISAIALLQASKNRR